MATSNQEAFERVRAALALGLVVHAVAPNGEKVTAGQNKTAVPGAACESHKLHHDGTSRWADTYYGNAVDVAWLFVDHVGRGAAKRAALDTLYREEVRECLFGPRRTT